MNHGSPQTQILHSIAGARQARGLAVIIDVFRAFSMAAQEIITGSFVNAAAIVAYIKSRKPDLVSLVAMGSSLDVPAEEDTLCAEYLQASLVGHPPDFAAIKQQLRHSESAKIFFDPDLVWAPERDFELCLSFNKFDFVLRAQPYQDDLLSWQKISLDSPPG